MRPSTTEHACGGHPSSQRAARTSRGSTGRAQHHGRSAAGRCGVALRTCRRRAKGPPAGAWVRLAEQSRHCLCKPQPLDTVHSPCSRHVEHGAALHGPEEQGVPQTLAPSGFRCWYRPSWTASAGQQHRKVLEAAPWPWAAQDGGRAADEMAGLSGGCSGMAEPGGTVSISPACFCPAPEGVTQCHKKSFV